MRNKLLHIISTPLGYTWGTGLWGSVRIAAKGLAPIKNGMPTPENYATVRTMLPTAKAPKERDRNTQGWKACEVRQPFPLKLAASQDRCVDLSQGSLCSWNATCAPGGTGATRTNCHSPIEWIVGMENKLTVVRFYKMLHDFT